MLLVFFLWAWARFCAYWTRWCACSRLRNVGHVVRHPNHPAKPQVGCRRGALLKGIKKRWISVVSLSPPGNCLGAWLLKWEEMLALFGLYYCQLDLFFLTRRSFRCWTTCVPSMAVGFWRQSVNCGSGAGWSACGWQPHRRSCCCRSVLEVRCIPVAWHCLAKRRCGPCCWNMGEGYRRFNFCFRCQNGRLALVRSHGQSCQPSSCFLFHQKHVSHTTAPQKVLIVTCDKTTHHLAFTWVLFGRPHLLIHDLSSMDFIRQSGLSGLIDQAGGYGQVLIRTACACLVLSSDPCFKDYSWRNGHRNIDI